MLGWKHGLPPTSRSELLSLVEYLRENCIDVFNDAILHVDLTLAAVALAVLIGVALGVALGVLTYPFSPFRRSRCWASLTHAKAAIADDEYGALFSANFDAEHGLTSGAEVGVRLGAGPALREATRHPRHAAAHADITFAPNPTQRELDAGLGAWWRTAWPFEPTIAISAPERTWRQFAAAATTGPVLYTDNRTDGLRLHCADSTWTLTARNDNGTRTLAYAGPSGYPDTASALTTWLEMRGRDQLQGRRGLCPALLIRQV